MAAVADHTCASCGKVHQLCYPEGHFLEDRVEYQYTCPTSKVTHAITFAQWNLVTQGCTSSSVQLTRIG